MTETTSSSIYYLHEYEQHATERARVLGLTWVTSNSWVSCEPNRTTAHGRGSLCLAERPTSTVLAGVHALAATADTAPGTLSVALAAAPDAADIWVSGVAWGTQADGAVLVDPAEGPLWAGGPSTRVTTHTIHACFVRRAVGVIATCGERGAALERYSSGACGTEAGGCVEQGATGGCGRARVVGTPTRVHALTTVAFLAQRTVVRCKAANCQSMRRSVR